jgi:hypothetical protein
MRSCVRLLDVSATQSFVPGAPPYALTIPSFRFRALASLAGRAPLGGPREVALATYLVARLVDDCLPTKQLSPNVRAERSTTARSWLSSLAIPTAVRTPLARLVEVTGMEVPEMAGALNATISATSMYLDAASRLELDRLAVAFTT